ncbi:hypothetical protein LSTR_LSTR011987 [Laodelphax striatellus]|uniref:O-phosphoseryl-tRNA(Sec) selenium transferase n=1 Tax=Laodelphax striatellus TaxID=195883 RepID=A0A482X3A8_LAOST|nr:hypothetical protein LSTR_LSTR011987 [Laodelphax striatellus]
MATLGSDNIVCVLSTTSCFAPRAADSLEQIAVLCSRYNIPHLVNNAYGLQSTRLMHLIQEAARKGRVDAFVQSTDKNFLVPVGGAVISGFEKGLLEKIAKNYPGRASASPAMDVFMTLLSLGVNGYKQLIGQRKEMYKYLKEELAKIAHKHQERLLDTKNNPISIAMTLTSLTGGDSKRISMLGSMLFLRCVSGTRVITGVELKEVAGYKFEGWGAHYSNYPTPYLTAAATLGMRKSDVDLFTHRLDKALNKLKGRSAPCGPTSVEELTTMSGGGGGGGRRSAGGGSSRGGARSQDGGEGSSRGGGGGGGINGEVGGGGGGGSGGGGGGGAEGSSAGTSLASSKDSLRK